MLLDGISGQVERGVELEHGRTADRRVSMSEGKRRTSKSKRAGATASAADADARSAPRALFVVIVIASVLLPAGSASALISRGHVFEASFGGQGKGAGEFEGPSQVAVDEASGDLYVVDSGDERVEIFTPDGHGGYAFSSEFKVHTPGAIAVDNSTSEADPSRGDVYVAGAAEKNASPEERDFIYEYSPSAGEVIHKWSIFKAKTEGEAEELELEDISGVSVDAAGTLWVYWEEEGEVDALAKEATKGGAAKLQWKPELHREPEIESKFECEAREGFAVASDDEAFYTAYERRSVTEECPGEEEETPDATVVAELDGAAPEPATVDAQLDHVNTTGVAIDSSNSDLYLDNGTNIAAFSPSGLLIQRFGSGELAGGRGAAVDAATGDVFVAEAEADKIEVFKPEAEVRAPAVNGISSQNLTGSSVELRGQIDPGGAQTEYYFEYGTAECASTPSTCVRTPVPSGEIEAGFGDREVSVEVTGLQPATAYFYRVVASNQAGRAEGVPSPNTFTTLPSASMLPDGRAWELVSPPEKHGAAVESISRYSAGSIQAAAEGGALVWMASGPVVGEPEGNRSFEPTQLLSRRGEGGWSTQSLETPHEQGRGLLVPSPSEYHYFSPELSQSLVAPTEPTRQVGGVFEHPPLSPAASEKTLYLRQDPPAEPTYLPLVSAADDTANTAFGGALEFLDASTDLQHVLFESKVGLTAAAPTAAGLFEWNAGKQASAAVQLVSVLPDGAPAPDEPGGREPYLGDGGGLNDRGAISNDGSHVVWTEARDFVPERLYLRDTFTGETIQVNAAQGNGATEPGAGGQTLPEPAEEQQEVHFQAASGDGSKVFFTDSGRLSEESSEQPTGEESPTDLYEFEVTSKPGDPLRGRLSDLTPDETEGSADVLNLIAGTSTDGEEVYFVANGVLAPGAGRGQCPQDPEAASPQQATCNLYASVPDPEHPSEREIRFIATLSSQDAADWGAGVAGSGLASNLPPSQDLSAVTSSVSANGQYLAFMSDQSLTGYDNLDTQADQPDEEVYQYDASSGRLVCASCNPNPEGEGFRRPHGVLDTKLSGEGFGLLVDRPEIWRERWLAASIPGWDFNITNGGPSALYQPRYLTDGGRLFFDSPDQLVPAATNGKEDVYEYEPDQVGSCASSAGCVGLISSGSSEQESAFLDASENGEDAFFTTAGQLVPGDTDHAFDVYDAHVCSQSSPCLSSTAPTTEQCESTSSCHGPAPGPAAEVALPATASVTTSPPPGAKQGVAPVKTLAKPKPLTRPQKLAKALTACRRLRNRHKRHGCEAQARKRYAAKKHTSKHKVDGKPKGKATGDASTKDDATRSTPRGTR
jgi:DNA-binding beta-propeller fold protein YncE